MKKNVFIYIYVIETPTLKFAVCIITIRLNAEITQNKETLVNGFVKI